MVCLWVCVGVKGRGGPLQECNVIEYVCRCRCVFVRVRERERERKERGKKDGINKIIIILSTLWHDDAAVNYSHEGGQFWARCPVVEWGEL